MAFYVYLDKVNQWRWYLKAANNRKIADSGEGYLNYQDCLAAIGRVMDTTKQTVIYKLAA